MVAQAAAVGSHVTSHQLVPGVAEGDVQGGLVRCEELDQLQVAGILQEGHVCGEHHDVGDGLGGVRGVLLDGAPLVVAARPDVDLPVVFEQVLRIGIKKYGISFILTLNYYLSE
ncbi:hypothetical protein Vretimale_15054, partial [Volvox reticuliferus]